MNCCENNNKNTDNGKENGHKGHLGHILMMALCCGAPVIIILLIPLIGRIGGSGVSKALSGIAPFLCPLMMLFMIPMIFKGNKNRENNNDCHQNQQLQSGEKTQGKVKASPINIRSKPTNAGFLLNLYIPPVISLVFVSFSIPTRQEFFINHTARIKAKTPKAIKANPV